MKELSRRTFMLTAGCLATVALVSPISAFAASGGTTADGWEILEEGSHGVTWIESATAAAIASAIAEGAAHLIGASDVIASMGSSAVSSLVGSTGGGTVYYSWQMKQIPFSAPQYRCEWSFMASTGDTYGPYYKMIFSVVSDPDEEER